jgi:raffinose/stachyose/melibiose transport system substrate-binding protein
MAAVVTAAAFSLSAASATTSGSGLPKGHYTLTVFADQDWVRPPELALAEKFKRKTGITIKYDIIPDSSYQQVLTTKLNSGQKPGDIYMGQPPGGTGSGLQTTFAVLKHAVDLSKQPWVNREFANARALATYKGKLWGQTIWDTVSGSWVIVYNKADFAAAGITSPPKTFAQFTAACAALKAKGINPIYEPISDGWHQVLWFPENMSKAADDIPGLVQNLNNNTATFAGTPLAVTAMTQINSLYQAGYFGPTSLTDAYANTIQNMAGGKYAMTVNSVTLPTQINAANPNVAASNYGFMPVPILNNQYINQNPGGPTKFVYRQGKHVDGALAYLNFLAQPANLNFQIAKSTSFVTLNFKGVKSKWTPEEAAFEKAYQPNPQPVMQVSVNYVNPQWGQIGTDMAAMFTGQLSPKAVLESIDSRRAQQAQAAGDPHWH